MGNCANYDKDQDKDINLANESQYRFNESLITNLQEGKIPISITEAIDKSSQQSPPLIEIVEINHFKRPMIKRSLTTTLPDPPLNLVSPNSAAQSKRASRVHLPQISSKEKQSFLFKAKEKLKKSKTSKFLKDGEETNTEDSSGGFYSSVKVESKLRKHLLQLMGDSN